MSWTPLKERGGIRKRKPERRTGTAATKSGCARSGMSRLFLSCAGAMFRAGALTVVWILYSRKKTASGARSSLTTVPKRISPITRAENARKARAPGKSVFLRAACGPAAWQIWFLPSAAFAATPIR